jgi:hypothetical protein
MGVVLFIFLGLASHLLSKWLIGQPKIEKIGLFDFTFVTHSLIDCADICIDEMCLSRYIVTPWLEAFGSHR